MFKIFILIFIIISLFTSCSKKDSLFENIYPKIYLDSSKNQNINNATPVESNKPIVGFFNRKDAASISYFYKVVFSEKSVNYEIILSAVPGVDARLKIYDENKRLIYSIDDQGIGEPEKVWDIIPRSDYIYLEAQVKIGRNTNLPFVINFIKKQEDSSEEIEPNNLEKDSNLLRLNETKKGYISPQRDVDFYKVIVEDEKNHDFSVEVESFSNLDIMLTIINTKTGTEKKVNNFPHGGTEVFPYLNTSKGEYLIKVEGNINELNKKDPIYYISIKEIKNVSSEGKENNFEQEFNDDFTPATDLISGNEVLGTLLPENDSDFYKFELYKKPVSVDLSLSRVKGIDPIIEIYDSNKKLINTINNNGKDSGEQTVLNNIDSGRFYIKIHAKESALIIYKFYFFVRY